MDSPENHLKELFHRQGRIFIKCLGQRELERAPAGGTEAGNTGRLPQADSLGKKGEHHVRTLYGEGTARHLLRAI